jgi:GT2 family glycosyltransferase
MQSGSGESAVSDSALDTSLTGVAAKRLPSCAVSEAECEDSQAASCGAATPTTISASETSVVICTRERPQQLKACLESLARQNVKPREILVVDNAPTSDATRRVVDGMPGIRYLLEPRIGGSFARNTGIRSSSGRILAFTDDDIIVHPRWITRLVAGFRDPRVMAVTGLSLPAELETEAQLLFEKHWSFARGFSPRTFGGEFFHRTRRYGCPVWQIGGAGNLAVRREAFSLLGGFDERLGPGAAGCSEDSELFYRIVAAGWHCCYEPSAVVFHHHRRDQASLNRQLFYYMRGHVTALLVQFEKHRRIGNLRRLLFTLPQQYVKAVIYTLRHHSEPWQRTLKSEICGCLSGIVYYFTCVVQRGIGLPRGTRGSETR